jgi:hypothetical protein
MLVLSVTVSALYSSLDGIVKFDRQLRLPTEQELVWSSAVVVRRSSCVAPAVCDEL